MDLVRCDEIATPAWFHYSTVTQSVQIGATSHSERPYRVARIRLMEGRRSCAVVHELFFSIWSELCGIITLFPSFSIFMEKIDARDVFSSQFPRPAEHKPVNLPRDGRRPSGSVGFVILARNQSSVRIGDKLWGAAVGKDKP